MEHIPEFVANHLYLFSLLLAILTLLIWNLYGDTVSGIRQVIPMEVTRLINHENAVVIDLRKQEEFESGHILNAKNFLADKLIEQGKELDLYKPKVVILCCNTGTDSTRVARMLMQKGFEKLYCLKGGLQAWRSASLPLNRNIETKHS
jgi:rhodanese-related sulfurtransferase